MKFARVSFKSGKWKKHCSTDLHFLYCNVELY